MKNTPTTNHHPLSTPLPPGSTIGILGGGQLGRMLAMAAARMGYHCHIYSPEKDAPAFEVAKYHTQAAFDDQSALKKFASHVDVITYEFENIPVEPLRIIADKIRPGLDILATSQHRLLEKQAVGALGISTAPFAPVTNEAELQEAISQLGLPCVLKTATMGYDGKGQWKITKEMVDGGWWMVDGGNKQDSSPSTIHHPPSTDLILEGFIEFTMEISVIVARGASGEMACYPPVQNIHKNHILAETIAPAPISEDLAEKAEHMARAIAEGMGLVGLMAVEMFVTADDILVNELAPRPHNSGHWTMDACTTSQFEQTIRAVCGLPLGSTERLCDARMQNLIGDEANNWQKYMAMPNAKLHLYGKSESRPGRKMGHVTFIELKD